VTLSAPAPLADHHEPAKFNSGVPELEDWLRRRARSIQIKGVVSARSGARWIVYWKSGRLQIVQWGAAAFGRLRSLCSWRCSPTIVAV